MKEKKKQKQYTHIKKAERLEIAILLKKDYTLREIARVMKRSPGAISQEITRNSVNGIYNPHKAQQKAYTKRKYAKYQGMKIAGHLQLRSYVEEKLKEDWSPEEIAGRIKCIDTYLPQVSYTGVYKYIYSVYGRQVEQYLRYRGKKKYKKGERTPGKKLEGRTFIDKRPQAINERKYFGDWEGDFIVSGKNGRGALLVLHERKGRYTLLKKLPSRDCREVNKVVGELTGGLLALNSLTLDNDVSFQKHEELSRAMNIPVYFCHPYHSWEKGGVENTNKLIRQYIPKRSDISKYSEEYIKQVERKLNSRPRKCLGYKTPLEVMNENNQFKTIQNYVTINSIKNPQVFSLRG